jgi:hypothetical protein
MSDRIGCINAFQEQYKTFERGQEEKIWRDRCHFGVAEEITLQSFWESVIQPICMGKPSRYSFTPRIISSSESNSSLLEEHLFRCALLNRNDRSVKSTK